MAKPNHDETTVIPYGLPNRTLISQQLELSYELHSDDGRPKTRRVNPERLASRLDPELVAKMEALIFPGAKMPSFAVRQVFQEEYNVDRRHIYDYFHSRGLRVAKEDRYTNLTRGRVLGARPKPIATQYRNQPHTQSIPHNKVFLKARLAPKCPKKERPEFPAHITSYSSVESPNLSSPDEKFDWSSPPSGFAHSEGPPDTPLTELLSSNAGNLEPGYLDDSLVASSDLEVSFDAIIPSKCGLGLSLDEELERPLTEDERIEYYNLINDNIGPAEGIQESTGTYDAHMKEQTFTAPYLDDETWKPRDGGPSVTPNLVQDHGSPALGGTVDFQKWLLPITPFASGEVSQAMLHTQCGQASAGVVAPPHSSIKQVDIKQSVLTPPHPSTKFNLFRTPMDSNAMRIGGDLQTALSTTGFRVIPPATPNFLHRRASTGGAI
ncbi:hypothetical protein BD779DRAFT_1795658 [Infundibulicybe gibba]|nr:hypothetical protein BD779DRAFT_1795658 [Infundibulicybe gibba]